MCPWTEHTHVHMLRPLQSLSLVQILRPGFIHRSHGSCLVEHLTEVLTETKERHTWRYSSTALRVCFFRVFFLSVPDVVHSQRRVIRDRAAVLILRSHPPPPFLNTPWLTPVLVNCSLHGLRSLWVTNYTEQCHNMWLKNKQADTWH